MSELRTYKIETDRVFATGQSNVMEGEKIDVEQIVKVTHIAGTFENCATTEYIELGYYNGHDYVELKKAAPLVAGYLVHWDGEIYLREGHYIYAKCSDVANGEKMKLRAEGKYELW